jgi:hypothetical protein
LTSESQSGVFHPWRGERSDFLPPNRQAGIPNRQEVRTNPNKTCHSILRKELAFLVLLMMPMFLWAAQGEQAAAQGGQNYYSTHEM